MAPPAKKAVKKAKRYVACRTVSRPTSDGEVHFRKGDEITEPLPEAVAKRMLHRGDIEEMS